MRPGPGGGGELLLECPPQDRWLSSSLPPDSWSRHKAARAPRAPLASPLRPLRPLPTLPPVCLFTLSTCSSVTVHTFIPLPTHVPDPPCILLPIYLRSTHTHLSTTHMALHLPTGHPSLEYLLGVYSEPGSHQALGTWPGRGDRRIAPVLTSGQVPTTQHHSRGAGATYRDAPGTGWSEAQGLPRGPQRGMQ